MTMPPPQYGQQPGYYPPQPTTPQPTPGINGLGLTGLIIGTVALLICWIPWLGFAGIVVGFIGLVFGILGIALEKYRGKRMLGIIATIVSGIAFVLSMFLPFITGLWWTWNWLEDSGTIDSFETLIEQEYETYSYEDAETDSPTESSTPGGTRPEDLPQPDATSQPEETFGSVRP